MNRLEALQATDILSPLRPTQLLDILRSCPVKRLSEGEVLVHAGEPVQGLHVVIRGSLRAYRLNAEGREQVIHVERAGHTMAEVPLFDGGPCPSTVRADEECEVLFIPKARMEELFRRNPQVVFAALRLMACRVRKTAALVESISLMGVDQRVGEFLLQESGDGSLGRLQLPPNPVVAGRLGTVREMISKSLSGLERRGIISLSRDRKVSILDFRRLREIAASGRRSRAWREQGHILNGNNGIHSRDKPFRSVRRKNAER